MSKPSLYLAFLLSFALVPASKGQSGAAHHWPGGKTYNLKGLNVTLSASVLVGRRKTFYWFPKVARRGTGDLIAHASLDVDDFGQEREEVLLSSDGGLTWRDPKQYPSPIEPAFLFSDIADRRQGCGKRGPGRNLQRLGGVGHLNKRLV